MFIENKSYISRIKMEERGKKGGGKQYRILKEKENNKATQGGPVLT
jgi:hypothetical protein